MTVKHLFRLRDKNVGKNSLNLYWGEGLNKSIQTNPLKESGFTLENLRAVVH